MDEATRQTSGLTQGPMAGYDRERQNALRLKQKKEHLALELLKLCAGSINSFATVDGFNATVIAAVKVVRETLEEKDFA